MAYKLTWYTVGEVLRLDMHGNVSLDEMKQFSQRVMHMLDKSQQKLTLLIDVSALIAGYTTVDHLRATQQYTDHPNLDAIVVISGSKLNQLIILLSFHLSRARFVQFDSKEKAQMYMVNKGFAESPMTINS